LEKESAMKQGLTNVGKKESRQLNQVLTKSAQGDTTKDNVAARRSATKQHRFKGRTKS
jgi:hypothetical protein